MKHEIVKLLIVFFLDISFINVAKKKGKKKIMKLGLINIEKEKNNDFRNLLDILSPKIRKNEHKNIVLNPKLPFMNHLFIQIPIKSKFNSQGPKFS